MRAFRWIIAAGVVAAAVVTVLISVRPADAIPAWTRKYGVDCNSCHVAGFKLTRMGQDFLRAGHQMEGGKEEANLSDHVSVAQKSRFNWSETETGGVKSARVNSFEQHALAVYMGGPLQKDFSYFAELYWHENSGKTSGTADLDDYARSKLADAYVQYLNRQDEESYTSIRFGQLSPFLLHLHGTGARLSQNRPYVLNDGTVGDNPYKPFTRQYGIEVSQFVKGFNVAAAMMNGTGAKLFNRVDNDLKKDVYGTLDYSFDQYGSMLGVYGYAGHYPLFVDKPVVIPTGTAGATIPSSSKVLGYTTYDDFNQLGVLGNLTRKQGALVGALFTGKNEFTSQVPTEAWFPVDSLTTTTSEIKSMGYYAEVQLYTLHPRVQPFVRYDFWDPNTDVDDNEVLGPLFGISWRALDAGRLVAHYTQLKTKKPAPAAEPTKKTFTFEVNFMF
ncbi:MAG: hypothetical protein AAB290_05775 [Candidatus Eisenbacteria bacterium]